jgi:Skp family chaperone for outer membrane proteins
MLRTAALLCALCLTAAAPLRAADAIQVEKLALPQLREALKGASDDTPVEYNGVTKTLAEWRTEFQAKFKPPDPALLKQLAADQKAKFDAAAKALQDQQDKDVAAQNAQIDKEYDELTSR